MRLLQEVTWAAKKATYVSRPALEMIDQPDVLTTNTSACPLMDTCIIRHQLSMRCWIKPLKGQDATGHPTRRMQKLSPRA